MKQFLYLIGLASTFAVLLTSCNGTRAMEQRIAPPASVVAYQVKSGSTIYYDEYPAMSLH